MFELSRLDSSTINFNQHLSKGVRLISTSSQTDITAARSFNPLSKQPDVSPVGQLFLLNDANHLGKHSAPEAELLLVRKVLADQVVGSRRS